LRHHYSFLFTATDVDTVFGFKFRQDPSFFSLDNVVVEAVATTPIPATSLLLLTAVGGIGGLGFMRRRNPTA